MGLSGHGRGLTWAGLAIVWVGHCTWVVLTMDWVMCWVELENSCDGHGLFWPLAGLDMGSAGYGLGWACHGLGLAGCENYGAGHGLGSPWAKQEGPWSVLCWP
jgi:hypothetical protein